MIDFLKLAQTSNFVSCWILELTQKGLCTPKTLLHMPLKATIKLIPRNLSMSEDTQFCVSGNLYKLDLVK